MSLGLCHSIRLLAQLAGHLSGRFPCSPPASRPCANFRKRMRLRKTHSCVAPSPARCWFRPFPNRKSCPATLVQHKSNHSRRIGCNVPKYRGAAFVRSARIGGQRPLLLYTLRVFDAPSLRMRFSGAGFMDRTRIPKRACAHGFEPKPGGPLHSKQEKSWNTSILAVPV